MIHSAPARLTLLLGTLCAVTACNGGTGDTAPTDGGGGQVAVTPPQVKLAPGGTQSFASTPPKVTWSVKQAGGGTISTSGLYTAPATPGTYTVVATESTSGLSGQATVNVVSSGATISHGMAIPPAHPRLWYDATRLTTARTWYATHASSTSGALKGLLANDSATCRTAITQALTDTASIPVSGTACDDCRWSGEDIILVYDWCYPFFTDAERSQFIATTNGWVDHWRTQSWGGPGMHENNYYWGYVRNELEWALASYDDNVTMAETFLDDVLVKRMQNDFNPQTLPGGDSIGGVGQEGTQYGLYIPSYATIPWVSAGLLGRDLLAETNYWREQAYQLIYTTSPAQTSGMGYTLFPYSDDENWTNGGETGGAGTFMNAVALRWAGANVGQHARQWMSMTGSSGAAYVKSVDPGGIALPFTSLPLDYFAPATGYFYGRNAWGPTATTFVLQLGDRPGGVGHSHVDWGTWQIWRNGQYLSRESVGYSDSIAGYGGSGSVTVDMGIAHNSVLKNGAGPASSPWGTGVVVTRVDSQPGYAFASANLTKNASAFSHLERDFVFVRGLETLVVFDRIQTGSATDKTAFINHCGSVPTTTATTATCTMGTQALVMTTLVPAAPTIRVVAEGGVGQQRIEVEASPGATQSYQLTVLQAKDASAAALSPTVTDNGTSYTVTLNGSNSITFQKGPTSSGGSVTVNGTTSSLRAGVQSFTVTDAGPAWGN
jgi:hypothetical protein